MPADSHADASSFSKTPNAVTVSTPVATNEGHSDGREPLPRSREQDGDHANGFLRGAVSQEHSMATSGEEPSKDIIDETGEEIVEAAEDTVIY